MRTLSRIFFAIFCATIILSGDEAFPQAEDLKIPWTVLPILQGLDEKGKSALLDELKRVPNYGACKSPILDCLLQEKPDVTAVRISNFAAYLLSKGVPPNVLGPLFSKRAAFMESAEIRSFDCKTAPVYGDEKAPIRLTEFAEFKCPFCGTVSPLLKKLIDDSQRNPQA